MDKNVGQTERMISVAGGSALALMGLRRRGLGGLLLATIGGFLIYRGSTGSCPAYSALGMNTSEGNAGATEYKSVFVEEMVVVEKSPEEIYRFWRNFENLPKIMSHLESVTTSGERESHWVAKGPLGTHVEWDAELVYDKENERLGWRSKAGADVDNAGSVQFEAMPGGKTTRVHVSLSYRPPAGKLGAAVAKLLGEEPSLQIRDDLQRFKKSMESGALS
ncbi:putative membrane protein [Deinobacterium chartae]|uniref:Putative membrane protein n=1 Tax=Deinobacterium chartae TaxID=521158 RepID=A0A841I214_9DEIO|nr:SRPBCC family protein [Deinobacterium chartae]MBB6098368.1 putative membrane protein [Deinobacterium chartae]